jgi:hypothetical protein
VTNNVYVQTTTNALWTKWMVNMGRTMRYLTKGSEVNVVRYLISCEVGRDETGRTDERAISRGLPVTDFDDVDPLKDLIRGFQSVDASTSFSLSTH